MAFWRPLRGLKEISIGGFKGLNETVSPVDRPLGSLSAASNVVIDNPNALKTRPGLTAAAGAAVAAAQIMGLHRHVNVAGVTDRVLAQAGSVLKYSTGTSWTTINAGTIASVTITAGGSGYTSAPTVAFTGGGGSGAAGTAVLTGDAVTSVTITNAGTGYTSAPTVAFSGGGGSGATGTAVTTVPAEMFTAANLNDLSCMFYAGNTAPKRYNGTAYAALGGSPPNGAYVVEAHDQLFVGGISGREGDLDFCDVGDPETWTAAADNDAGSITVSQSQITWVDYDRVRDKVLIWTEQEFMMLIGPETPNRPNLWSVQTISQVGCPAGRTVVNADGTWMWLTADSQQKGFAFWRGGDVEVVTEPFRTTMAARFPLDSDSITTAVLKLAAIKGAAAWLDRYNRYYCGFTTGGTHILFIYDPKTGAWTLGTGTLFYAASKALFNGRHVYLVGDGSGNVYEVRGTADGSTAITYTVEIGPTQYGDPFKATQIVGAVVVVSLASGATMTASFAPGESAAYGTGVALTVDPGTIASVTITAGGSGYTSAPTVAFTGGGGSGAAGTAVLTGDAVTSVTITNAGTGYTSAPTVAFSGGGGSGATGTAVTTKNTTMTQVRVSVPVSTADTQRAGVWRMKLTGSGVIEIHDVLLRVYQSGRVI